MEINKISVGVEALDAPVKSETAVATKLIKIRNFSALGLTKISGILFNLLTKTKSFVKNFSSLLASIKIGREIKDKQPAMHDTRQKLGTTNKLKKTVFLVAALFILVAIAVAIKSRSINVSRKNSSSTLGEKVEINGPLKTLDVNREFQFPVKDAKGKVVTKLKYFIEKAELRDEIVVKGQKATAVKGRVFLIIYLKVTNEFSQKLDINTRNYIRLSVNGNENEWLAPDIHNDPVEVQAQSTKATRLGYPINESDTKLLLRVGEIDGDKERVELNF